MELFTEATLLMSCPSSALIVYVSVTRPELVVEALASVPTEQLIALPPVTDVELHEVGPGETATLVTVKAPLDRVVSVITTSRA